jgi:hypothetical protein
MEANHAIKIFIGLSFLFLQTIVQGQEKSQMTMGNGANNWIVLDDVKRDGSILTFSSITIEGDG